LYFVELFSLLLSFVCCVLFTYILEEQNIAVDLACNAMLLSVDMKNSPTLSSMAGLHDALILIEIIKNETNFDKQ